MITDSPRFEFLGAHVTPDAKEGLKDLAAREDKSISRLVYEAVVAKLRAAGYEIEEVEDKAA